LLRILTDQNIYKLDQFLPEEIELITYDPERPMPGLEGFDALLVRSLTKLNELIIPVIPESLKLIGTGSSGSDHIDIDYFEKKGVKLIDAKGSNANAVSEYVITSLLLWSIKKSRNLSNLKIGIIGAGATGTSVKNQLSKFGIPSCSYDPPRQVRESDFESASLDEVLSCDILTFHVPLIRKGDHTTFHWLDEEKLHGRSFELVINASRGGVINELALLEAIENNIISDVIIDVWEDEPNFNTALVEKAFIATPHIAGYSEQAKLNASKMLAEKLSLFFEFDLPDYSCLYTPKRLDIANLNYSLYEFILRLHPLREYDADLRELCLRPDKKILFQRLRIDRPYRFEYPYLELCKNLINGLETLNILGVKTFNENP